MIKKLLRQVLDRLPYVSSLRRQVTELQRKVSEQGVYEAGHYYSPIPSSGDVMSNLDRADIRTSLSEIDLQREAQFALLEPFAKYYEEGSFPEEKNEQYRYYFNQPWFCYADAIFLYCFIRHFRPKRIIEIGSGFSSAVILDTLDRFPYGNAEVTFIEPSPERLLAILEPKDKQRIKFIEKRLQEVDLDLFRSITSGDLLFIDSSHVFKYGSDLQRVFCEILPMLPVGTFVHFHDIFCRFEYPAKWLAEGRYWNEDYFLRAFLAYNDSWKIVFFNNYVGVEFQRELEKNMPICLKDIGGSIYLQRIK